jgi:hypothetical protein
MNDAGKGRVKVLYIAGSGRSGSTLLELLLNESMHQPALGELFRLWRQDPLEIKCGCGKIIGTCPFWQEVFAMCGWQLKPEWFNKMLALQMRVVRWRRLPWLLFPKIAPARFNKDALELANKYEDLYEALSRMSKQSVVVDASKNVIFILLLKRIKTIDLRVVHLVRDPRGVAYSWRYHKKRKPEASDESYLHIISPLKIILLWWSNLLLPWILKGNSKNYKFVAYEDFADNPEKVVQSIFDTLEIAGDMSLFDAPQMVLSTNHTVSGNPLRFESKVIEVKKDENWRKQMPGMARAIVSLMTWPWLLRLSFKRKCK